MFLLRDNQAETEDSCIYVRTELYFLFNEAIEFEFVTPQFEIAMTETAIANKNLGILQYQ